MSPLSARYAPHIAVLAALALVPVLVHSYVAVRVEDCAHPDALGLTDGANPILDKDAQWIKEGFAADAWRVGQLPRARGAAPLQYLIVRSWDPKRLYYRPEYRLIKGTEAEAHRLDWVESEGERVPIHRLEFAPDQLGGTRRVGAYLLVYESRPVSNPYLAQLLAAPRQLLFGGRPMTLLFVLGSAPLSEFDSSEQRAIAWLLERYRSISTICD